MTLEIRGGRLGGGPEVALELGAGQVSGLWGWVSSVGRGVSGVGDRVSVVGIGVDGSVGVEGRCIIRVAGRVQWSGVDGRSRGRGRPGAGVHRSGV